jgi:serine/threonine protein kinase
VKEEDYGKQVDMWSLGIILYILLCGFPPFYHEIPEKIFPQIERGTFDFPGFKNILFKLISQIRTGPKCLLPLRM